MWPVQPGVCTAIKCTAPSLPNSRHCAEHASKRNQRAKKPCAYPCCPALLSPSTGLKYCEKHKDKERRSFQPDHFYEEGTTTERGYGAAWRKLRMMVLREHPFCQSGVVCDPDNTGRKAPSTTVDHIKPKALGGTDDDSNLQALCDACHAWKTANVDSKLMR